ncbi:peptidoglycan/xylan/chitin deacetylase (PgdA/CDA1 family) [Arthrobacter silviterrae]|uniref:Polysaccharide deacetylase family protein n=1 Tax=Arthrobacter silviterrae TaxID=2026658 RepID=A0ABX0DCT8_9MICC|nr:polysaccharide deacetylase family protein [Arthrobacter silviterrae]MDQ0276453.1 peptidoglycan/xylan/chitin deacetylase (PgdA/CDA1 family) [Arthrobacter silviterrae]NGN84709.1 polysaccharide deacetylase family protein [Arthrobacter silviterrae]
MNWPHNARCAVAVTIDIDGDLPFLALDPEYRDRLKSRSVGLYGPDHGAQRLLAVLEDLDIRATWFVPGAIATTYSELVRHIAATGHEVACHGTEHLDFDTLDAPGQVEEILSGRAMLEEVLGTPVTGFRTPAGEWGPGFVESMADEGFLWSSSLPCDDRPFWLAETGVLEIPFRYELEDLQYLGFNLDPPFPPGQSRIASHQTVRENWRIEFEAANRWGTLFLLRLNAEIMGTPGRAELLRQFLTEIQQSGTAWIASCGELHSHFASAQPHPEDNHPYSLFTRLSAGVAASAPAVAKAIP